jgi:DNA-binding LytR/AlgR family response regulator
LEFLESLTAKPFVVITTAHEEYALKCFEYQAIGYLVKPIPFPSFLKVVNRILGLLNLKVSETAEFLSKPSIFVKVSKKKLQKVYLDEILVVESMKDYIRIKTTAGNFIAHQSLSSFTDELPANAFIRIHRSFTIAIDKIESIESNQLQIDGVKYVIGRQYLNEVRDILFK